jgi:hypothetical protein
MREKREKAVEGNVVKSFSPYTVECDEESKCRVICLNENGK